MPENVYYGDRNEFSADMEPKIREHLNDHPRWKAEPYGAQMLTATAREMLKDSDSDVTHTPDMLAKYYAIMPRPVLMLDAKCSTKHTGNITIEMKSLRSMEKHEAMWALPAAFVCRDRYNPVEDWWVLTPAMVREHLEPGWATPNGSGKVWVLVKGYRSIGVPYLTWVEHPMGIFVPSTAQGVLFG